MVCNSVCEVEKLGGNIDSQILNITRLKWHGGCALEIEIDGYNSGFGPSCPEILENLSNSEE